MCIRKCVYVRKKPGIIRGSWLGEPMGAKISGLESLGGSDHSVGAYVGGSNFFNLFAIDIFSLLRYVSN